MTSGSRRAPAVRHRPIEPVGLGEKVEVYDKPQVQERVYVWDLVVRATHWLIFLAIVVLSVTGFYIGRPVITADGPTADTLFMGLAKVIHSYAAIVFSVSVLARIIWMFTGPEVASWRQFIPVQRYRIRDMWGTFLFYTFLRPTPPPAIGHNPLAGATYVLVFLLYFVEIGTGFALYSISASAGSYMAWFDWLLPVFGGAQAARWIHHVIMWLLLGFMVHHVYSAWLMALVEKNGTLDSIFSGYKFLPKDEPTEPDEGQDDGG